MNIQLRKELEKLNQLPYLDVLVTKSVDKFETTVFRKKTNTNLSLKWSSLCPTKFKCNLFKCLLDRAYCISSSYKGMHLEFNSICQQIDNDLSISQNVSSNKMIHAILAFVFVTKLFLLSGFSASKITHVFMHFFSKIWTQWGAEIYK